MKEKKSMVFHGIGLGIYIHGSGLMGHLGGMSDQDCCIYYIHGRSRIYKRERESWEEIPLGSHARKITLYLYLILDDETESSLLLFFALLMLFASMVLITIQ
jgi:hypothetical protein